MTAQRALSKADVIAALGFDPQGKVGVADLNVANTDSLADVWTSGAANVGSTTGAILSASGTVRTKKIGRTVLLQASVQVTSSGNAGGLVTMILPYPSATNGVLSGVDTATGKALTVTLTATSTSARIAFYDGSFPGSTGASLYFSGAYQSVS